MVQRSFLDPGERAIVDIDTLPTKDDISDIYGYLAVFDNELDAQTSVYELLEDEKRIDLDRLVGLKNKMVIIGKRHYGFKGDLLDYSIPKRGDVGALAPELDFVLENQTGQNLWLSTFIYQKKGHKPQWKFVKLPLQFVRDGQEALVDVDTIAAKYDRRNVRAFIGLFEEDEIDEAENMTYEMLRPTRKLKLGKLYQIRDRKHKVVLRQREYGLAVDREHKPHEWFYEFALERRSQPISWYRKHA